MSEVQTGRLQYFPPAFFAMIMGLGGLTLAVYQAHFQLGVPPILYAGVLGFASMVFAMLFVAFMVKLVKYPQAVKADFMHPVRINFLPTLSIALIILAMAWTPIAPAFSVWLWWIGAVMHFAFTLAIVSSWMHHQHYQINHINASWFIPPVGNILLPILGVSVAGQEVAWFFFSIGLILWIVLLGIIFYRVIFHDPLPAMMVPTFFILIAPPAVGFISYVTLVGEVDGFARILYYASLFLFILLATQFKQFTRLNFTLSWWAYSFPMAAMTLASLLMYQSLGLAFFFYLSWGLLVVLTVLILLLLIKTFGSIAHKRICQPH